jgi:two-component system, cell cycle sensor histidine kinase and response regulator CckA
LLVEDNLSVLSATRRMLANVGCTVYDADHPRNAREVFAAHSDEIDLLLTDVLMPEMNGPELASQLRTLRPRLPILYMSGCIETSILDSVDSVLLSKPFSPDELVAAIRRAIAIPQPQFCTSLSQVLLRTRTGEVDVDSDLWRSPPGSTSLPAYLR